MHPIAKNVMRNNNAFFFQLKKNMKADTCSICFNEINSKSNFTKTECDHFFCSKCIFEWILQKRILHYPIRTTFYE